jgi:hypothetical protein
MENCVADYHIRAPVVERHLLHRFYPKIGSRKIRCEFHGQRTDIIDSLRVPIRAEYFVAFTQQVNEVPTVTAAGIQYPHSMRDAAFQKLIEKIDVDLPELFPEREWGHSYQCVLSVPIVSPPGTGANFRMAKYVIIAGAKRKGKRMKIVHGLAGLIFLLSVTGCNVDSGPVENSNEQVDAGAAESVHAEVRMSAGELHIEGGAPKLMTGTFRYSERIGRPTVRYDVTGAHGRLLVESPKNPQSSGKSVNTWDLQMSSDLPLDMTVNLGAGESTLDMSRLQVRSVEVNMGAGEMTLNMSGKYKRDVTVHVQGGVGEARIQLPKDIGAEVTATGGIGSIDTKGLTKRVGKYYNAAYSDDKPAVRMEVQGGIGNITLSAE